MNFTLIFENIIYWIEINYILSIILLFLFIFFYSLFSIPGLIFFLVFSGYAFGLFLPYFVCIISFTLGCFCFFILSKLFLNKFFQKYYVKYSSTVDKYIKNSTIEYLIIFRLVPGTPLFIQNTLLSLLKISNFKFLFSTFVGATPLTLFVFILVRQCRADGVEGDSRWFTCFWGWANLV